MNQEKNVKGHVYTSISTRGYSLAASARGVVVLVDHCEKGHIFVNSDGKVCFHLLELQLREKL